VSFVSLVGEKTMSSVGEKPYDPIIQILEPDPIFPNSFSNQVAMQLFSLKLKNMEWS